MQQRVQPRTKGPGRGTRAGACKAQRPGLSQKGEPRPSGRTGGAKAAGIGLGTLLKGEASGNLTVLQGTWRHLAGGRVVQRRQPADAGGGDGLAAGPGVEPPAASVGAEVGGPRVPLHVSPLGDALPAALPRVRF